MKKSLLLLSAGLMAVLANAQESSRSIVFNGAANSQVAAQRGPGQAGVAPHTIGYRTTSGPGGSRWYDYVNDILANETAASCVPVAGLSNTGLDIWQDTTSMWGYTGGTTVYSGNDFTSLGLGFDPMATAWNDPTAFPGVIAVSAADNYTIDSVAVRGWYNRSYATPHKTGVIDTLVLTFVQGNGTSTSNMPPNYFTSSALLSDYCAAGQLNFLEMLHDSLNNRAGNLSGTTVVPVPTTQVFKFLLNSSDTNNSDDTRGSQYPRAGHSDPTISFPVSAGNYSSMSVSFISGDGATSPGGLYPAYPAHDTVRYSNGTAITGYKYGDWTGNVIFSATTSGGTVANFPPYNWPSDHTSGYFKREGAPTWGGAYIPNWGWTNSLTGGGSALQYPLIAYHITCTTCYLTGNPALGVSNVNKINKVNVYPNPANDKLIISYYGAANNTVTVSLSNMLGQTVVSQQVTNGTAVFNTSSIPAGVYVYTVEANGDRSTGRVVVAH